ncbi:putative amidoligase enzyme-domain-containing protein [Nemania sp. FL0031]|nr:putative amidoligase enzyme-domain-containing protein [Nemania sp. FL0031]
MVSEQQTETFTVPVGTRLSQGIELEFLIAYVDTNEDDPDEADSANLPPLLRINTTQFIDKDTIEEHIEELVRGTLRNHGIPVNDPNDFTIKGPRHLANLDEWFVTHDGSVQEGIEERELTDGKSGPYSWYGMEVRSPALWDDPRVYDEVRFVVNLLKSKYRIRINPSCGFHVHVGNGAQYFRTETLKRFGALVFAADPLLSRLHAPWRRVAVFSKSIRYESRLARWEGMTPADSEALIERLSTKNEPDEDPELMTVDVLPVLPWSDRTREVADFRGQVEWEQYANDRVRDGPFITLTEKAAAPMFTPTPLPPMVPSPPHIRGGGKSSPLSSLNVSIDSDSDSDNGGGAAYRRVLELMKQPDFRQHCFKAYKTYHPERLTYSQLLNLIVTYECGKLFGRTDLDTLSTEEFYRGLMAVDPYIETLHTVYEWNPQTNELEFQGAEFAPEISHPQPLRYNVYNAEEILTQLDERASERSRAELAAAEDGNDSKTNTDESEDGGGRASGQSDTLEQLFYDRLDELMSHPTFPLERVEALVNIFTDQKAKAEKRQRDIDALFRQLYIAQARLPVEPTTGASPRTATSTSSTSSSVTSGGFNPPAARALDEATTSSSGSQDDQSSVRRAIGFNPATLYLPPPSPSDLDDLDVSGLSDLSHLSDLSDPSASLSFTPKSRTPPDRRSRLSPFHTPSRSLKALASAQPHWSSSSSSSSSDSGGGSNPAGFDAIRRTGAGHSNNSNNRRSRSNHSSQGSKTSSSLVSNPSSGGRDNNRICRGRTLRPHDYTRLPRDYVEHISEAALVEDIDWARMAWLPRPGGRGPRDPVEPHVRGPEACLNGTIPHEGEACIDHVATDTRAGLAAVLAADSAGALATMLMGWHGTRPNYSLAPYELDVRRVDAKRTVEFREAAGTLDPDWVILWSKICLGIMRFCRDASVGDFLEVLERVVSEEERQRTVNPQKRDRAAYDVCDLLEDVCLFAEATTIREREKTLGPPR